MLVVTRPSEQFHPDRVASGNLVVQEVVDAVANDAAGVTEKFNPGRGVNEDHVVRGSRCSAGPHLLEVAVPS